MKVTPLRIYGPPDNFDAQPGNSEVVLSWDPISEATKWQVRHRQSGGNWTSWADISGSGGATDEHRVTGLTNGTTYEFQVRGFNNDIIGPEVTTSATPNVVPAAPTGLKATPHDGKVILSWADPQNSNITSYEYEQDDDDDWKSMSGSRSTTTEFEVTGLTNDTAYKFRIRSKASVYTSAESDQVTVTPHVGPNAPGEFRLEAGAELVKLSWKDPSSGPDVGAWQYRELADGDPNDTNADWGEWTDMAADDISEKDGVKSFIRTGLTNRTNYHIELRGISADIDGGRAGGSPGTAARAGPARPEAAPGAVSLSEANPSHTSVTLKWVDPQNADIDSFEYSYHSGDNVFTPWVKIENSTATTIQHIVTGLTNRTTYTFRVQARTAGGVGGGSNTLSATPNVVPPTPTIDKTKTVPGDSSVTITFSASSYLNITSWEGRIKEKGDENDGTWTGIETDDITEVGVNRVVTLTSLDNDTTYVFQIRAVNGEVRGEPSEEDEATPHAKPGAPQGLAAVAGDEEVGLSWTDPANIHITGYEYQLKAGSDTTYGNWTPISGTDSSTTKVTVEGLTNGTPYMIKIRAVTEGHEGVESAGISATPQKTPPKPEVSLIPGDGKMNVTVSASSYDDIDSWQGRIKEKDDGTYTDWIDLGTDTTFEIRDLKNGTTYVGQMRAVNGVVSAEMNAAVPGPASDEVEVTPDKAPSKPQGFELVPGHAKINLVWSDQSLETRIDNWQYQEKVGDADWGEWIEISGSDNTTTSFERTGLTNGTTYGYMIRARTVGGVDSAAAGPLTETPVARPGQITLDSATPGDTLVKLEWTGPSNPNIQKFQYSHANDDDGNPVWHDFINSNAATTEGQVTGLTNGQTYTFRVQAVTVGGGGGSANSLDVVPNKVPPKPAIEKAVPGNSKIVLTVSVPVASAVDITRWQAQTTVKDSDDDTDWKYFTATAIDSDDPSKAKWEIEIDSLTNDTTYVVEVRAVNGTEALNVIWAVFGQPSEKDEATPHAKPGAPAGLAAVAGDGEVTLNWTDPANTNITGYEYRQKEGTGTYGAWMPISDSNASTTTAKVTDLNNDTIYAFKIRAVTLGHQGNESAEVSATPKKKPPTPIIVSFKPGNTIVDIIFSMTSYDDVTDWEYRIKKKGDENYPAWARVTQVVMPVLGHPNRRSMQAFGLENDTTYVGQIRAVNGEVPGEPSVEDEATPHVKPGVLADFKVKPGDAQVTLSWTNPQNANVTEYQYEQDDNDSWVDLTLTSAEDATTMQANVTSLTNGNEYSFKIRVVTPGHEGEETAAVTATPHPKPGAPADFKVTPSNKRVTLSWTNPNNANITGYQYEQNGGAWTDLTLTSEEGATILEGDVKELKNGDEYSFRIRAVTLGHDGTATVAVKATPNTPPAKPDGFDLEPGDAKINLVWDDQSIETIIDNWQYQEKVGDGDWGNWTEIRDSDNTTTSFERTGLTNGTAYSYRIRARTVEGVVSDAAGPQTATPIARPSQLTLDSATPGNTSVELKWTDPGNADILRFQYSHEQDEDRNPVWHDVSNSNATTTNATVSGLTNGQTYTFRVQAVTVGGGGGSANSLNVVPNKVPPTPTIDKAVPGDGKIVLTVSVPALTAVDITRWQVQTKVKDTGVSADWKYVNATSIESGDPTKAKREMEVDSLRNDTTYVVKVRAVNGTEARDVSWAVFGLPSAEDEATPHQKPDAPEELKVRAGNLQVTLIWKKSDNTYITGYEYQQKASSDTTYGKWTPISVVDGSDGKTKQGDVTGLTNSTAYTFKLRAVTEGHRSDATAGVTTTPDAPPGKPSGFTLEPGDAKINLVWNDQSTETRIDNWQYQEKVGDGDWGNWTEIRDSDNTTTSFERTGLTNGTSYSYMIRARTIGGVVGEAAVPMTATPIARPSPLTLDLAMPGNTSVELKWTDPGNADILRFQYSHGQGDDSKPIWHDVSNSTATTTEATVSGLTNGQTYTFSVQAVTVGGGGGSANSVNVVPNKVPPTPTIDKAVPGDGKIVLTVSVPVSSAVDITRWQVQTTVKDTGVSADWKYVTATSIDSGDPTKAKREMEVDSLTNATTYVVKVRAVNGTKAEGVSWAVFGLPSEESNDATPHPKPGAPADFAVVAGDGEVTLNWTDPANTYITGYEYRQKEDAGTYGNWTPISHAGASIKTARVTGLENGKAYTFKLRALTLGHEGDETTGVSATPQVTPPKPTIVKLVPGDAKVIFTVSAPSYENIDSWQGRVKVKGTTTYSDWEDVWPQDSGDNKTFEIGSLTNGTTYVGQVRAVHGRVSSSMSAAVAGPESDEKGDATPHSKPGAPQELEAELGNTEVTLVWKDPENAYITRYEFNIAPPDNDEWNSLTVTDGSKATTKQGVVTGLTNGTEYTFKIRAITPGHTSDESATVSQTPKDAPPKPSIVSIVPGDEKLTVTVRAPAYTNVTSWQHRYKTSDDADFGAWAVLTVTGSGNEDRQGEISGLTNNSTYTVEVRALNVTIGSEPSDERKAKPHAAPGAPTNLAAAPGDTVVTLTWTAPASDHITGYEYQQKTGSGAYGNWEPISGSNSSTTKHVVRSLTNGTEYTFKVRAVTPGHKGAESSEVSMKPNVPASKPQGFRLEPGNATVKLIWNDQSSETSVEWWQYREGTGDPVSWGAWTRIPGSTSTTTEFERADLTNGTTYHYRIRAVGAGDLEGLESDIRFAKPAYPPSTPRGLTASAGDGRVFLSWSDPNNDDITRYEFQYKEDGGAYGDWMRISGSGARTTNHTVTGLENGKKYFFKILAATVGGESSGSAEASATPNTAPAQPSGFALEPGNAQIKLVWNDQSGDASNIVEWEYQQKIGEAAWSAWTTVPSSNKSTQDHTFTGLTNETVYGYRIRAEGASSVFSEASPDLFATPKGPPVAAQLTAVAGPRRVTLTWTSADDASISRWQYQQKEGTNGSYGAWEDIGGSGTTTRRHVVLGLTGDVAYSFKVRAIGYGGTGAESKEATATPAPGPSAEMEKRVLEQTVAAVANATLSSATDTIGHRFDAAPGVSEVSLAGQTVERARNAPEAMLAPNSHQTVFGTDPSADGRSARDGIEPWDGNANLRIREVDEDDLLWKSGFTLSLSGNDEGADGAGWTLWGRGDWLRFEGVDGNDSWEGEQWSGWLGADTRMGERTMAGLAVSRGVTKTDYKLDGEFDGNLETSLTAVWPYLQLTTAPGSAVRLVLGVGTGNMEHRGFDEEVEEARVSLVAGSLSGRFLMARSGGTSFSAIGGASLSQIKTNGEASTSSIAGLKANSWRVRAGVEAAHDGYPLSAGSGWTLAPRGSVSARQDGGDGVNGSGLEVSAGVRLSAPSRRFSLDASSHWLALHSKDGIKEWGASLEARLTPKADGRGLSLSFGTGWGHQHRDGVLAREGLFDDDERQIDPQSLSFTARTGYGFSMSGGLLTPFAELSYEGDEARTRDFETGISFARGEFDASITAGLRDSDESDPETRVGMELQLRY